MQWTPITAAHINIMTIFFTVLHLILIIYIDVTVIQHATNNVADPRLLLFHSPLPQQTSTV